MKKVVFTTAVLLFSMMGSLTFAQSNEKNDFVIESGTFWHNWFVSGGVGTSIFMGDSDRFEALGHRFAPAIDLSVGKWFTPYIGARFQYSGPQLKGYTLSENGKFAYGSVTDDGRYKEKWNYMHFHFDAMLNLSNVINGYKEERFYSFIPYAGAGYARNEANIDEITIQLGLHNSFRINSSMDLFFDIRGTILGDDKFDYFVSGVGSDAMITSTIGVTYKFGKQGWKRPIPQSVVNDYKSTISSKEAEITNYKSQLAESNKKSEALAKQLAVKSTIVQETKTEVKIPTAVILFKTNSAKLENIAKVNLAKIADILNEASTGVTFSVVGYADNQTGNSRINDKLSEKRAEAVYDYLTKECGVDGSKLAKSSKGGVDNMFYDDASLSRVVIIKQEILH